MTDIDFDELDRAVGSAMSDSGASKTDEPERTPMRPGAEVSRPLPQMSAKPRVTSATRPRTGRFMDVKVPSKPKPADRPAVSEDVQKPMIGTDMPDPIDVHEQKIATQSTEPDLAKTNTAEPSPEVSSGSPFLPDTKVEKRPLGAFSKPSEAAIDMKIPSLGAIKPEDLGVSPDADLPEELQRDVLRIESDNTTREPAVSEVPALVSPTPSSSSEPTAVGSTPVFDTKDYHLPLKHSPKKKSGWLTVLWIVAVAVIGAAAGAFVFFFFINK